MVSTPWRVPRRVVPISFGFACLDTMIKTTRSKCDLIVLRISLIWWGNKVSPCVIPPLSPPSPSFAVPVETKGWGRCGRSSGVSSPAVTSRRRGPRHSVESARRRFHSTVRSTVRFHPIHPSRRTDRRRVGLRPHPTGVSLSTLRRDDTTPAPTSHVTTTFKTVFAHRFPCIKWTAVRPPARCTVSLSPEFARLTHRAAALHTK